MYAGLEALGAYRQFIAYKLVPSKTKLGKTDKLPIDHTTGNLPAKGSGASSIWTDAQTAFSAVARLGEGYGVGFSFAESDPFFFVDIDNCVEGGDWSALAKYIMAAFPGAYIEVSQSGRGLHIIGTGTPPPHACKHVPFGLELYHADRFIALTGISATGSAAVNFDYVLPWLVEHYFPPTNGDGSLVAWSDSPVPEWRGPADDAKLIERAMRSKSSASAFGNRASFADLYTADVEVLSRAFPDEARAFDASSADAALAQHLAFWTGNDCERIRRIMETSNLVRDKWERVDYLPMTISNAVARQVEVLQDKPTEALTIEYDTPDGQPKSVPSVVTGSTYADIETQVQMFTGCVYVVDLHRILIPGGTMLKPDQFRVMFGGFSFPMDPGNERISRNAWEAFTESQAFRSPRADTSAFRPDLEPGAIVRVDGQSRVNTYWPVKTQRKVGDPSTFLTHLEKILPNKRDREILLAYMAAIIQHKGVKFQWAPLIQGVEGNGKSFLTKCVAFAIGERYSHYPKASQIAKNFNAWMHGTIFIGVEDVYVPQSQQEILEELKPMITGDRIEIEKKGVDQVTLEVCCNFILNCNEKGAIRKTRNDRRFAPLYCAQQIKEHLLRDGMGDGYMQRLYKWAREGGYAIVNEYLSTYDIPDDLNPALGHIAPLTSSTNEALTQGLGRVEQEILEAIEREEVGFRGGWVSSMKLDSLLERIGAARSIPHNKRRDILLNLGYDYHPGLTDGRVNNSVLPDGGKPRLFVTTSSPLRDIMAPTDIARAYSTAQAF